MNALTIVPVLAALLAGCSHVTTRVEIYRGPLPSQDSRARERHLSASRFIAEVQPQLAAVTAKATTQCGLLKEELAAQERRHAAFVQAFARGQAPEELKPLADALATCLGDKYDATGCAEVRKQRDALVAQQQGEWVALVVAKLVDAHPETAGPAPSPRTVAAALVTAVWSGQEAAERAAHEKYRKSLAKDFKPTLDWRTATSPVGVEVLPELRSLTKACEQQLPALQALDRKLTAQQSTLATVSEPPAADPTEQRDYRIQVHAAVDELLRVRVGVIAGADALAGRIDAGLAVLRGDALRDATAGLALDLKALARAADESLQFKADPTDGNLAIITARENEDRWNRVDVDALSVHASGRSRHIVVQDSPINFRLKELNSDPTAVVKFGLTAADVGLEVLNAVVLKGALGEDGEEEAPADDGDAQEAEAQALQAAVDAASVDLQRELAALSRAASDAKADPAALRARLDGLLQKYQTALERAAKGGS
jgi:hypothetical protein